MDLNKKIQSSPHKPGCYLYLDKNEKVIYVGKAKDLNKRVSSYFKKTYNAKTTKLVRDIVDVNFFITENEKEALVLEQNLIKKYKPKYNVVLNDDRRYPYIVITDEKDPQYLYVRKYSNKYKKAFGPLPDGVSASKILETLQRIFPLRRCKGNLNKPCIHFHIEQCSGACFKDVDYSYYEEMIAHVEEFFKGNTQKVVSILEEKMIIASNNLQFEESARIRDIIKHINFAVISQNVDLSDNIDRDVFSYFIMNDKVCFNVLFYWSGKLILKDDIVINYENELLEDLFQNFISQIYQVNKLPDQILVQGDLYSDTLISISNNRIKRVHSYEDEKLVELATLNAEEALKQIFIKSSIQKNKEILILNELQKLLKLENEPYHIEIFDIANIMDEFVTGAMVSFKGAKPSYNDFRKYNIDIKEKSDFHRVKELIYRRFYKCIYNKSEFPDLIIVDGGKIQINAAKESLDILGIDIPIIGLVKNDKHSTEYIQKDEEKIFINKTDFIFNFLKLMQDRVHEYAISSFRSRKSKGNISNELTKIDGLGSAKISKLFARFDNIEKMSNASLNEIDDIIKNQKTSQKLYDYLLKYKNK